MTSFQQSQANRRNALRSPGPRTAEGKQHSRLNAVRHGLAAETVVGNQEDADDYKAFEATIVADCCAETAVARELVLRLASLLRRVRRAAAIAPLFAIDAVSLPTGEGPQNLKSNTSTERVLRPSRSFATEPPLANVSGGFTNEEGNAATRLNADVFQRVDADFARRTRRLTYSFLPALIAAFSSGSTGMKPVYGGRLFRSYLRYTQLNRGERVWPISAWREAEVFTSDFNCSLFQRIPNRAGNSTLHRKPAGILWSRFGNT